MLKTSRGLAGFNSAHVPGGGEPGPGQTEQDADTDDDEALGQIEIQDAESAVVKAGEPPDRLFERVESIANKPQGQKPTTQAVPESGVKKRSSNERIAGANQFRYFDFFAAILYVEPNRVANDDDDRHTQKACTDSDRTSQDVENGMKTLHPDRVYLHQIRLRQISKFFVQENHRLFRIRATGPDDQGVRQWIVLQMIECAAEARSRFEFLQRFLGGNDRHMRNVGALLDQARQAVRIIQCNIVLQIYREIERVFPVVADRLSVLDYEMHRRGKCKCYGNDEHGHQARKRLAGKAAQSADAGAYMKQKPDRHRAGGSSGGNRLTRLAYGHSSFPGGTSSPSK